MSFTRSLEKRLTPAASVLALLLAVLLPASSQAIVVQPGQVLRADFDLSAETPAPPWDFLRQVIAFNSPFLPAGETYTVTLHDVLGGPAIDTFARPASSSAISSSGIELRLTSSDLLDAIGVLEYTFTTTVDVRSVQVRGRNGPAPLGSSDTNIVTASLTVADVPAPATTALVALGLIGAGFAGRRRTANRIGS